MKKFIVLLILPLLFNCNDAADAVTGPKDKLTAQEISDLQFMKEEEKLARDVYLFAAETWDIPVFSNIAKSEQTHMNKVTGIIVKYGVEDISSDVQGAFFDPDLQNLYNELTAKVLVGVEAALEVGATIEDLDISDLENAIGNTSKEDIIEMYSFLKCGSENHIRAFVRNLTNYNVEYTPQFISESEYLEILAGSSGGCNN